jgi:hypothetical protein
MHPINVNNKNTYFLNGTIILHYSFLPSVVHFFPSLLKIIKLFVPRNSYENTLTLLFKRNPENFIHVELYYPNRTWNTLIVALIK